jgi:multiple sugar transport system permease protein
MAETRECLWGYFFATPWLIGLLVFTLGPILASVYLSTTKYDVISTPQFIGAENFVRAFTGDELFWPSMARTFRYALSVVPLSIIGSLLLALMLNQGYRGTNIFRTLYFLPHLTPAVAMGYLWRWLLQPSVGPVNFLLKEIGIANPPGWLADPRWALSSLAMIALWGSIGGNNMLIFLAGLQGVPQELYDAADVDGAGPWHRFWAVTLPMISPALFFNLVMGIIGALKAFAMAYVSTQGGPSRATWFYALHLYTVGFQYFEMGYAAALAWIFAVVIILITMVQFRLSRNWVYYAGA